MSAAEPQSLPLISTTVINSVWGHFGFCDTPQKPYDFCGFSNDLVISFVNV